MIDSCQIVSFFGMFANLMITVSFLVRFAMSKTFLNDHEWRTVSHVQPPPLVDLESKLAGKEEKHIDNPAACCNSAGAL